MTQFDYIFSSYWIVEERNWWNINQICEILRLTLVFVQLSVMVWRRELTDLLGGLYITFWERLRALWGVCSMEGVGCGDLWFNKYAKTKTDKFALLFMTLREKWLNSDELLVTVVLGFSEFNVLVFYIAHVVAAPNRNIFPLELFCKVELLPTFPFPM